MRGVALAVSATLPPDAFLYIFQAHRGKGPQEAAKRKGRSNASFLESWHNTWPALAFDCVPLWRDRFWPTRRAPVIEWGSDRTRNALKRAADAVEGLAEWGGRWKKPAGDIYHFEPLIEGNPLKLLGSDAELACGPAGKVSVVQTLRAET
jgi:hypothetical protein